MSDVTLTVATYNLQKCVGLDLRRNPHRVLEVLQATGAEIAVLQEADKRLAPRPAALPRDLVDREGWRIVSIDGAAHVSLGWHGNAMLVRPSVSLREAEGIDLPGLEPRGAIRADFDTALGPLRVIGVHLGLVARSRRMQCAALRQWMERLPPCPTVLCGDFNAWGPGRDLEAELGLPFAVSPASYPAPRPVARLDRFALSAGLQLDARVHLAQPARVASDHLPLVGTIRTI